MAKPIFLIQVSRGTPSEATADMQRKITAKLTDWHVLVIASLPSDKVLFSAFSEQSSLEVDLEIDKLKEMILNQI